MIRHDVDMEKNFACTAQQKKTNKPGRPGHTEKKLIWPDPGLQKNRSGMAMSRHSPALQKKKDPTRPCQAEKFFSRLGQAL